MADEWADFRVQKPAADEWEAFRPKAPASVGLAEDVGKGAASGLAKGAMNLIGGGGDARETTRDVVGWAARKLGASPGVAQTAGDVAAFGAKTLMPLLQGPTTQQVKDFAKPATGDLYEAKTVPGQYASTVAEFLPAAIGGPGGLIRRGAQVLAPALASETAGQVAKDTPYEPYVRAAGAVAGSLAPSAVPRAVARAITPNPISAERKAANALLEKEGVTSTTAGEVTGNTSLRYKESMAGGRAQAKQEEGLRQLTAAALRRIGETGHDAHEAVQRARPRIGGEIESASKRMVVRLDKKLGNDLVKFDQELLREGLSEAQVNRILAQRNNVLDAFEVKAPKGNKAPDSIAKGKAFHNLIKTGSPLMRATQDADASVAHYANRLRESLMDAAERTARGRGTKEGTGLRQALEDFQKGRRDWANLRALEDVASNAGGVASQGILTPAAIRQLATARDRSNYARGRGDFAGLARASNTIMAPLPNSGTAQRQGGQVASRVIGTVLGGGVGTLLGGAAPVVGPMILGPALAGLGATLGPKVQSALLMSELGQKWLKNQTLSPRAAGKDQSQIQRALIAGLLSRPEMSLLPER